MMDNVPGSRRPRHDGNRRRRQRARHLSIIRHVYPDRKTRADAWASGPQYQASPWRWAPSSGVLSLASPAGVPSSGSTWGLASLLSFWPPWPSRDIRPTRAPHRRLGIPIRRSVPGLYLVRRDSRRDVGLHRSVDRGALHRVAVSPALRLSSRRRRSRAPCSTCRCSASPLRRFQFRRVRRLFRHLLHLLLHGLVPAGRRQCVRLSNGGGLSPDGGRTDHRLRPDRSAVARVGARWPMALGCLLAGGGILVANAVLSPTVDFGTLGWVLPLAGIGIGILLVPVTSVPLPWCPRSGRAWRPRRPTRVGRWALCSAWPFSDPSSTPSSREISRPG